MTGWWDRLIGTISNYIGMVRAGPEKLRADHRLIVGPWGHDAFANGRQFAGRDFGPDADISYTGMVQRFCDRTLKGRDEEAAGGPVRIFILNENRWHCFAEWPPEGAEEQQMFLGSGGNAATPLGDGVLSDEPVGSADSFTYDPSDPVMSLLAMDGQSIPCDQAPLAHRRDILVYQTRPLEADLVVLGPTRCHLWAATDAPDTDFTAKLIEVAPDGATINLTSGIVRASFRDGFDRKADTERERPCEYVISMGPVGMRFRRGSRIRLDISSSDFPSYDRNHNTGRDFWSDTELRIARQTVLHSPRYPSRLVLTVAPHLEDCR